ncbi:ribonuclease P protein subunit [Candidatus Woesearchaeota archaeon]|nr:ribonuclease P protein subunit [Candidatus Woesearchaeota archaeon]
MNTTPGHILREEFIGLPCKVVTSSNINVAGMTGVIIDETLNTFVLRTASGDKTVMKKGSRFIITKDKDYMINGDKVCKRPHERIMLR